jgi:hypothetical protein
MILLIGFIPIAALPFLFVSLSGYATRRAAWKSGDPSARRPGYPLKSMSAFAVPVCVLLLLSAILASMVRSEVARFISDAGDGAVVRIDHEVVPNPRPILDELGRMSSYFPHHSSPKDAIEVEVESGGSVLKIVLRRDSDRPNEYWVFYPRYRATSMREIGRITTDLFDAYR